jgi:ribokinase
LAYDRRKSYNIPQETNMPAVWVAGSINMDIVATAARHPRIGETVPGTEVFFFPGGKGANQAVAAAKLGAQTALIGKVGVDAFGRDLRNFLAEQNVDLKFLRDAPDAHTGTAVITVADGDNAIIVVPGANALVSERDVMEPDIAKGDILVSQFEIPIPTIKAFFSRARAADATTILNPAPAIDFDRELLDLVDILILNETELGAIAGRQIGEDDLDERIIEIARTLQTRQGQTIAVTLGRRGALAWAREKAVAIRGEIVEARDPTGAGDCFVGAVAAQTALGAPIERALDYANVAASICVQRMGAGPSMPTQNEVAARLESKRS